VSIFVCLNCDLCDIEAYCVALEADVNFISLKFNFLLRTVTSRCIVTVCYNVLLLLAASP